MAISERRLDEQERELLSILGCAYPDGENEWKAYEKLKDIKNNAIRRATALMLGDLYDLDVERLSVDMAKVVLLDCNEDVRAKPSERLKLLRVLWWIISVYFDGDDGLALSTCRAVCPFHKRH